MNNSLPNKKKLVPISDAAEILGVSIDTIRRWDKSGILHSERPDGKNRYFSLSELEHHKAQRPLTISEVAKKLNMSTTTLRRLETRGVLQPERNKAGERVYHKDTLNEFLSSDYYRRKKQLKELIKPSTAIKQSAKHPTLDESIQNYEKIVPNLDNINPPENPTAEFSNKSDIAPNLKPQQRIPEFIVAAVIFVLLVAIGVTNITLSTALSSQSVEIPAVLSETVTYEKPEEASISAKLLEVEGENNATESGKIEESVTLESIESLIEGVADFDASEATEAAEEDRGSPSLNDLKIILTIKTGGAEFINIREKPSTESGKIGKAIGGQTFDMVSRESDWYEIKLSEDLNGYVSEKFVQIKEID